MPEAIDSRGQMTRKDRQMPDPEARAFLREHAVGYVGTRDEAGWPYVVPLMYVYEEGDHLFLHTGARGGHFLANAQADSRLCLAVGDPGPMHRGSPSPCNSALTYKSIIVYGTVRVCDGPNLREQKAWFFDRLLERLGESRADYEAGYTMLDRIILYEVKLEIVTGKINVGLHH
ncbi:MAG TPA: pyridoxamine 5'-phosphate oxidase family protein [Terriglobales bacterium]|nr:pyridoxamine 5'-phosphate oxidase family protein [Terriglobales bacterium]